MKSTKEYGISFYIVDNEDNKVAKGKLLVILEECELSGRPDKTVVVKEFSTSMSDITKSDIEAYFAFHDDFDTTEEVIEVSLDALKSFSQKSSIYYDSKITLTEEKLAVCFKPQSFTQEISDYYFNDSIDTLIRNEDDILLEVRVNDYSRSDYDSIDFEYIEELEELITEAKRKEATLLRVRCE